jgi:hypothetical protein
LTSPETNAKSLRASQVLVLYSGLLKVLAGDEVLVMVEGMGEMGVLTWPFAELANESNESVLLICRNICCCWIVCCCCC